MTLRQASAVEKVHVFGSCLITHDWVSASNKKKVGWIQQQFVTLARLPIEACLAMALARAIRLSPSVEKQKLK